MGSCSLLAQVPLQVSSHFCFHPLVPGKNSPVPASCGISSSQICFLRSPALLSPLPARRKQLILQPTRSGTGLPTVMGASAAAASPDLQERVQEAETTVQQSSKFHGSESSPTVVTFTIPEGSFGADFEADYQSQLATWPSDLANTADFHEFETFVTSAHALVRRWLAPELVSRLERFLYDPLEPPALVIRGLPVDSYVPPTGKGCLSRKAGNYISETMLVGISRIIGQPFRVEYPGVNPPGMDLLIRDIYTTPEDLKQVNTQGSFEFLDFHVDYFHAVPEHFPQVLGFMGVRGDPSKVGRTLLCDFQKLYAKLDPSLIKTLREHKLTWTIGPTTFSKHVIQGTETMPIFNLFEERIVGPDGIDKTVSGSLEAITAYKQLKKIAKEIGCESEGVWLDAGDALFLNQRKTAHGRSSYIAKLDGNDRWVQRVYINSGSFWEVQGLIQYPCRRFPFTSTQRGKEA
ncbi:unnamed protein product [Sphagnum troendelagicum]|uniref:TauD/TfdA-like domain-containing protein n=1 Tax=Sphagnum troendelagicum TaxID=128251 RepID=A0ABP0V2P2_9BRYO